MCDYSGKLIPWLDHELAENEAADVERHLQVCAECRSELDSCERVSRAFDAYCDADSNAAKVAAKTSKARRSLPRWILVGSGAAAAAAIALLLTLPQRTVEQPQLHPQAAAAPFAIVPESAPVAIHAVPPIRRSLRRHAVAPAQNQNTGWAPYEPAIQIAIPAEAMFPPGAIPEGVNFTADLSIGADGSVQRLGLRPRLAGFERRSTQP
jgi:anti-sigma factor RsiW